MMGWAMSTKVKPPYLPGHVCPPCFNLVTNRPLSLTANFHGGFEVRASKEFSTHTQITHYASR
jgi:hypothetical protein